MWMCERKQISFNSFEDTLELVKPAEKFDGFENQVISENQQCGSLEEVEDGAHGGGGGGKQGVPNARRKFSSKVKVESEEEAYMN